VSRHFELMQEALKEVERETPPAHESTPILFPVPAAKEECALPLGFDGMAREECLNLVQRIFLSQPGNHSRAIVFAGIDKGDGCSRICVETARILAANTSASVCIVDANFRTPSLPDLFGIANHKGLANALVEEGGVRTFAKQLKPSNLWLLSAGGLVPGSSVLLNSDRLKLRLQELREQFAYILIDSAALNLYGDAVALGKITDGVVVVLQADSTRRESALKALESLRQSQVEVLGAVLNRRTFPIPNFLYRRL
jgi:capsular exopolysaccharide synthesis family protein